MQQKQTRAAAKRARRAPPTADPIPTPAAAPLERLVEPLLLLTNTEVGADFGLADAADDALRVENELLIVEEENVPNVDVVVIVAVGVPTRSPIASVLGSYTVDVMTVAQSEEPLVCEAYGVTEPVSSPKELALPSLVVLLPLLAAAFVFAEPADEGGVGT